MLRAIFVIFFFQLLGEALKKFFEMRIPGPVI
ncbi:MAG: antiholin, partial [Proteobacteria bacterium]|nr:antiholin [Candidatus Fonsibacter lacus]